MDLIATEQKLDRQQERAIYELTLKKQRSKKSTVSHKQVLAMQQLANELLSQRKTSLELLNNELERRLHQYEYLVAQEKSILGTYNLDLFRNESVNNFHLFARSNEQKNPL